MREIKGNLWDYVGPEKGGPKSAIVIPTNGSVRKDGRAVMGRGVALQAKRRYPVIDSILGNLIERMENVVHIAAVERDLIFFFPVKYSWREKASLYLIEQSAVRLISIAKTSNLFPIYLPRVGCGNGARDWKTEVKPILTRLLVDDKFVIVTPGGEEPA